MKAVLFTVPFLLTLLKLHFVVEEALIILNEKNSDLIAGPLALNLILFYLIIISGDPTLILDIPVTRIQGQS